MKNIFNSVLLNKPKSSKFDLTHDVKLSFNMGNLIPTAAIECLPGDSFRISPQNFLRFAPLISPVMHRVRVATHYFFVPNRLLWSEWGDWIAGNSDVEAPYFNAGLDGHNDVTVGSLADYLGIPTGDYYFSEGTKISPMAMAAYCKIYDEFYRDQNLMADKFTPLTAGVNNAYRTYMTAGPLRRAWEHDYFTAALPWAQKGPSVQVPISEELNIPVQVDLDLQPPLIVDGTGAGIAGGNLKTNGVGTLQADPGAAQDAWIDPQGSLIVDVQAGATDINTLRRAFKLQEWLERNARGGTRYVESILSHFGVRSSDARLQRPEYLGGINQNMVISEVLATAENTDANVPVGQMAGHGMSVGGGTINFRCEEHGFLIGIISVLPETAYQQGLHRQFQRFDRLDYAWPSFANIGEQPVLIPELFATVPDAASKDEVFGYVPRYAEYKFLNSRVCGDMRDNLSYWHLGRIFPSKPALNETFVKSNPSTRIFAVTDDSSDHIFAHIFNQISVIRKLPAFGVPTL